MSNIFLNPFTNELIAIPSNINLSTSTVTATNAITTPQVNSNTLNTSGNTTNFGNVQTNAITMINTG
ncbi:MAG: hypothetical protein QXV17_07520, partial [Candidatus Micrarchaeaceae archaeon]